MKKTKKIMALLLTAAIAVTILGACGNSEKINDGTANAADGTNAGAEAQEDMAEISIMAMALGPMGDGKNEVVYAINAITEKIINTHVNITYVEVGSYAQQLSLAITGNEKVDLCMVVPIPAGSFSTLVAQNQLVSLNDLLPEYAPETVSTVGQLIKGATVNGNIYAVPTYRDLSSKLYIIARKDLLESADRLDAFNNMKTWTDYENIMSDVAEKNPDIVAIGNADSQGTLITSGGCDVGADNFSDNGIFDTLGDLYKIIKVDANGKVYDNFETDSFKNAITRANKWYKEGLVYKDAATSKDVADTLMKSNAIFSYVNMGETNVVAAKSANAGSEVVVKEVAAFPVTTSATTMFCWGVPVCSKEKEAAVKFLNLMYTNKDIMNLLAWGVEGRDYVVKDGVANYPDGVTIQNVAYHSDEFLWGNSFISLPWSSSADAKQIAKANFDAAPISPYLGFSCDTTKVSNELTAIQNVLSEYEPGLESGTTNNYDEFIKALKEAGIDKVITEYQTQLDAFVAAK